MTENAATNFDQPDWATQTAEIDCPLCGYNLRGLTEPRCPECGYQFHWPDLLDPSRQRHPYLFDHHPRANIRTFWQTAYHRLRPLRFWNLLRADQDCNMPRLTLYWFIVSVFFITALLGDYLAVALGLNFDRWRLNSSIFKMYGLVRNDSFTWPAWENLPFLIPALTSLVWPWITILTLMIFRASMRLARVKQAHVLRCVVYSWDIVVWISAYSLVGCAAVSIWMAWQYKAGTFTFPDWAVPAALVPWALVVPVFGYRMTIAYWRYLRFHHVILTIVASQCIVALLILTVLTYLDLGGYLQSDYSFTQLVYRWIR